MPCPWQALWLLGHPIGPPDAYTVNVPLAYIAEEVFEDVDRPMPCLPTMGAQRVTLSAADVNWRVGAEWKKRDEIIRKMQGPRGEPWYEPMSAGAVPTFESGGDAAGEALKARYWSCLRACLDIPEVSPTVIDLADDPYASPRYMAVCYTVLAYTLINLRSIANHLHIQRSY
jgi:hypothetical protein